MCSVICPRLFHGGARLSERRRFELTSRCGSGDIFCNVLQRRCNTDRAVTSIDVTAGRQARGRERKARARGGHRRELEQVGTTRNVRTRLSYFARYGSRGEVKEPGVRLSARVPTTGCTGRKNVRPSTFLSAALRKRWGGVSMRAHGGVFREAIKCHRRDYRGMCATVAAIWDGRPGWVDGQARRCRMRFHNPRSEHPVAREAERETWNEVRAAKSDKAREEETNGRGGVVPRRPRASHAIWPGYRSGSRRYAGDSIRPPRSRRLRAKKRLDRSRSIASISR